MKTRTTALAWVFAAALFATTVVQTRAQSAAPALEFAAGAETFHGLGPGHRLYFPTTGFHEPDSLLDATVRLGILGDTVVTLNFRENTISVERPAAQHPEAPAAASAGIDPECTVGFNPALVRVRAAADLLFEKVVPFLIKNFVGRP
jgi:hypothetical protein